MQLLQACAARLCRGRCCQLPLTARANLQVQPPGFILHPLPYTDEVRSVAPCTVRLPPAVLPQVPRARAGKVATGAAGALIEALSDDGVRRGTFRSPHAAFGNDVLRAQVWRVRAVWFGRFAVSAWEALAFTLQA